MHFQPFSIFNVYGASRPARKCVACQKGYIMDNKSLYKLTYGLFLLTARENNTDNGCIINTAIQVANNPTRIAISVIQTNKTHDMIKNTGIFNISSITTAASFDLFKHFGMQSGRDMDKFADFKDTARSENGLLYLTKTSNMYLSAKVTDQIDLGSHTLFIGELTDGQTLSDAPSCTYAYYQSDIKPKPAASSEKRTWTCSICGYTYEGDEVPDDYICPLCKHDKTAFVLNENTGERTWAAEHVVGVAKDVPEDIIRDLRANFEAECCEVGMYLAMARVAHREGYPEIGRYFEKAAWEEAEHAAKFAELLGDVITDSTRKNLEMRVAAEHGATAGKTDLAARAKQLNLDAIHDTVHEMARDEARHGKALEGLLKRNFK